MLVETASLKWPKFAKTGLASPPPSNWHGMNGCALADRPRTGYSSGPEALHHPSAGGRLGGSLRCLNRFCLSGASFCRKRSAFSRFCEMPVSAVCWFFLIWLFSLLPLKAVVVIFVVSKFDNDLPMSFLVLK